METPAQNSRSRERGLPHCTTPLLYVVGEFSYYLEACTYVTAQDFKESASDFYNGGTDLPW